MSNAKQKESILYCVSTIVDLKPVPKFDEKKRSKKKNHLKLDRTGVRRRNLKHDNGTGMFERGRIDAGDGLHAEGAHLVAQPELERGTYVHR